MICFVHLFILLLWFFYSSGVLLFWSLHSWSHRDITYLFWFYVLGMGHILSQFVSYLVGDTSQETVSALYTKEQLLNGFIHVSHFTAQPLWFGEEAVLKVAVSLVYDPWALHDPWWGIGGMNECPRLAGQSALVHTSFLNTNRSSQCPDIHSPAPEESGLLLSISLVIDRQWSS